MSNDHPTVLLVRPRSDAVGERKRQTHVVPVADARSYLEDERALLAAYCGAVFRRDTVDLMPNIVGMPCFRCLMKAPLAQPQLSAAT